MSSIISSKVKKKLIQRRKEISGRCPDADVVKSRAIVVSRPTRTSLTGSDYAGKLAPNSGRLSRVIGELQPLSFRCDI
jgi:hypothetical protein